eukprot:4898090-Pyramimonas_sp.AAC.1
MAGVILQICSQSEGCWGAKAGKPPEISPQSERELRPRSAPGGASGVVRAVGGPVQGAIRAANLRALRACDHAL